MYNFIIFWKLHYDAVCGDMLKLTFHSFVANVDCIQNQDVTEVNMLFLENVCSMCVWCPCFKRLDFWVLLVDEQDIHVGARCLSCLHERYANIMADTRVTC
jgi:hypothetical protein